MAPLLRPVTKADLPGLTALLRSRIETSMFPLTNLRDAGLGGDHRHGMQGWCRSDLSGAVFLTNSGMVQPQLPDATPDEWRTLVQFAAGRRLEGLVGAPDQADAFLTAAGLAGAPMNLRRVEPGYALTLDDLRVPPHDNLSIRPVTEADRALVVGWRAAYDMETLGTAPDKAARQADKTFSDTLVGRDRYRLLCRRDTPVALAGFNAVFEDAVQIGGVYTPPGNRSRGYARTIVALHLAEARATGIRRAFLFAANTAAARAYEAIGFARKGSFALVLFSSPQEVMPCP